MRVWDFLMARGVDEHWFNKSLAMVRGDALMAPNGHDNVVKLLSMIKKEEQRKKGPRKDPRKLFLIISQRPTRARRQSSVILDK